MRLAVLLHVACWAAAEGGAYYVEKVMNYMFWVDIALNFRTGCARIAVERRFYWQPCRPSAQVCYPAILSAVTRLSVASGAPTAEWRRCGAQVLGRRRHSDELEEGGEALPARLVRAPLPPPMA
jgi:hypothetical protein